MAVTVVTPTQLVVGTESADILDAGGTAADTVGDGWTVVWDGRSTLLLKFLADATGDTVTVLAGDNPPSHSSILGNDSIVLAASDVRYYVPDASRCLHDDGLFKATCTDTGTTLKAFLMPRNA